MKNRIIGFSILLAIVMAAVTFLPLPVAIDQILNGIQWGSGEDVLPVAVNIKGTYFKYLFRDNIFKGSIDIDGLDCYNEGDRFITPIPWMDFPYNRAKHVKWSAPAFYSKRANAVTPIGQTYMSGNFDEMVILLFRGSIDEDIKIVTVPAQTREEAKALTDELLGDVDYGI